MVPRTLAENSGQPCGDIVAALYTAHAAGRAAAGVDVEGSGVKDMEAAGIVDSLVVKLSALKLAAETAITVLRVDQIIMSKQARLGFPPFSARARRFLCCFVVFCAWVTRPLTHPTFCFSQKNKKKRRRAAPSPRRPGRAATTIKK